MSSTKICDLSTTYSRLQSLADEVKPFCPDLYRNIGEFKELVEEFDKDQNNHHFDAIHMKVVTILDTADDVFEQDDISLAVFVVMEVMRAAEAILANDHMKCKGHLQNALSVKVV